MAGQRALISDEAGGKFMGPPAERLEQVAGDPFSSFEEIYLWQCKECGGYFVGADPERPGEFLVGLIDSAASARIDRQLAEASVKADRLFAESPCTCDHRDIGRRETQ
jgi:hypothetical protein